MKVYENCPHAHSEQEENYTLWICELHPELLYGVYEADCEKCAECPNKAWQTWRHSLHEAPQPADIRPIYSPVDHYDVDVSTGTVTYHVVKTNGDRIRSMTDEELAIWISSITWCEYCPIREHCDEVIQTRFCKEILLTWLKEEVQDG